MRRIHLLLARSFVLVSSLLAFAVDPTTSAPAASSTPSATPEAAPASSRVAAVRHARPQCRPLLQRAHAHGWPEAELGELERVLWRESRCITDAVNTNRNGTVDRGALQINDVNLRTLRELGVLDHHDDLFDVDTNLKAGLALFEQAGGFCPWEPPSYCS